MPKTVNLLMVDDDEVDVLMFRRALARGRIVNPLFVAHDGIEALDILRGTADTPPLERPYIILLDLNMPRMNGLEFLAEVRADPNLHNSVIFVLTTSDEDRDLTSAYAHHVAGYILKSKIGPDFSLLLELLNPYWRVVELEP